MGKKEAIQEFEEAKKQKLVQGMNDNIRTVVEVSQKTRTLRGNLSNILATRFEHIDKDGKKRIIEGMENDASKGTLGTLSVFDGPEFMGHPFCEVSRNMHNHFKMYCLVNGVSDDEMLSFAQENPPKEVSDKIMGLKKGFFDMVANKDLDAVTDYYYSIATYIEKKLPNIMRCDDHRNLPQNANNMILLQGTGSYLQQTLHLNGYSDTTPEQQKVIGDVNRRLQQQGKKYTLNSVENDVFPLDNVTDSLSGMNRGRTPKMDLTYERMIDPELEVSDDKGEVAAYSVITKISQLTQITREMKQRAAEEGLDPEKSFVSYDTFSRSQDEMDAMTIAELFEKDLPNYSRAAANHETEANNIAARLQGNVRKGIFGSKKNSKEYDAVLKSAQEVAKQETELAKLQREGKAPTIEMIKNLQKAYQNLDKVSQTYLDSRNPASREGMERYKLVMESQALAKSGIEKQKQMYAPYRNPIKKAAQQLDAAATIRPDSKKIYDSLNAILREPFTHTDSKGITRTIAGEHNDAEKNTLGTLDVFATEEYMGQPFKEVSRNMPSHFKVYCLTKGLSEQELLSLTEPNVSDELKTKLRGMKADFMDMVIEKDLDKISDMYKDIAVMLDDDTEKMRELAPGNAAGIEKNRAMILKYSGGQSWLAQSIDCMNEKISDSAKTMVSMVDQKLAAAGKTFSFGSMSVPVDALEQIAQTVFMKRDSQETTESQLGERTSAQTSYNLLYSKLLLLQEYMSQPGNKGLSSFPKDIAVFLEKTAEIFVKGPEEFFREPKVEAPEVEQVPKVEKTQAEKNAEAKEAESLKTDMAKVDEIDKKYIDTHRQAVLEKEGKKEVKDLSTNGRLELARYKAALVSDAAKDLFGIERKCFDAGETIKGIKNDLAENKPFNAEKSCVCMAKICLIDMVIRGCEQDPEKFGPIADAAGKELLHAYNYDKTEEPTPMMKTIMASPAFRKYTENLTPDKLASFVTDNEFVKLNHAMAKERQVKQNTNDVSKQKTMQDVQKQNGGNVIG